MVSANPITGTILHAIGGMSAASCYTPYDRTTRWSWSSFWLTQSFFAWLLMPLVVGLITVPDFFPILNNAPRNVVIGAFILGGIYGFGGMSFGLAIRHIGYSLTYTIAIGISAVLGTLIPLMVYGGLQDYFTGPGSLTIITGMILSVSGVGLCGWAGFRKEKDLGQVNNTVHFNMTNGLILALIAGVLSAVFNISLEHGQPIADMAAEKGAGHFEGNAKIIVSTSGCFVVNFIWFMVVGIRNKSLSEFIPGRIHKPLPLLRNLLWSALAGTLWFMQFLFYGLGHVRMGKFQFISWVLHMSMLIFFSYVVGVIMKEWKKVSRLTYTILLIALIILISSFIIITYGSVLGEKT